MYKRAILQGMIFCGMLWLWLPMSAQIGVDELSRQLHAVHETYGGVRMEWRLVDCDSRPAGGRTHADGRQKWRVGSVAKVVVAMGIMKLVEDGKLGLEDPVALHLPELKLDNPWEATDPVRIVQLLEHSSGLDDMHFNEYYATDDGPISLEEALGRNGNSKRIRWRPGTCSAYSNVGYAIATGVIERLTGMQAGMWLQQYILEPIGMTHSSFEVEASTYATDTALVPPVRGEEVMASRHYLYYPAVGLVSTADDLSRLMQLFMGNGLLDGKRLLDSSSVARMMRHETTPARAAEWHAGNRGLGFSLWGPASDPAIRASGFLDGYIAELCLYPQHCRGWLVLSNDPDDDGSYLPAITDAFATVMPQQVHSTTKPIVKQPHPTPPEGQYRYVSRRNALYAFYDDCFSGLELRKWKSSPESYFCRPWKGAGFEVSVVGNDAHQWDRAPEAVVLAGKSVEGRDFLLVGDKYYEFDDSPWPGRLRMAVWGYQILAFAGLGMLGWSVIGRLRRRPFAVGGLLTSLLANLPFWSGSLAFWLLRSDNVYDLGRISPLSLALLGLSLVLPLAAILAVPAWWRWKASGWGRAWRWLHVPLILYNIGLMIYLGMYGLLPFISWTY